MTWLKRNLILVIGGVVALALLGSSGYYLWVNLQKETEIDGLLTARVAQWNELVNRKPHPGSDKVDNIAAAKADLERITALQKDYRSVFAAFEYPKAWAMSGGSAPPNRMEKKARNE